MPNQTSSMKKTQMNVTPTLIIMEGSTAGKIGYRIKRLLTQKYGEIPIVRFLWIDTDVNIPEGAEKWFSKNERSELVGYDANAVLQNIEKFPTINNWWPKNINVQAGMISKGAAQQMRLIGRLSLFRKFNESINGSSFLSKLQQSIESIHYIENINATREKSGEEIEFDVNEDSTRVIFIFSTCGGTGSSISFDLAYLCRRFLRGHHPELMAVSILPPVIDLEIRDESTLQRRKIRANSYAWFLEDQYLMDHPNWYVEYPGIAPVDVAHAPFDVHFVFDMVNEANCRLNSSEDIYKMISQAIFLDTGTAIAGENSSFFTNVGVLDSYAPGRKQAYSSLASASIVYPSERLLDYCGHRFAKDMLSDALIGSKQTDLVKTIVSVKLAETGLHDEDLVRSLREERGVELLRKPAILKAESVKNARILIEGQMQDVFNQLDDETKIICDKQEMLFIGFQEELEKQISSMVIDSGLQNAKEFVNSLQSTNSQEENTAVTSLYEMVRRIASRGISEVMLSDVQGRYEKAMAKLSDLDGNLLRSAQKILLSKQWENAFDEKKKECFANLEQYAEAKLSYEAQRAAKDLYSKLLTFLQNKSKELGSFEQDLKKLNTDLVDKIKALLEPQTFAEGIFELKREVLGNKTYFLNFYNEKSETLVPETVYRSFAEKYNIKSMQMLLKWGENTLKDDLVDHAKQEFALAIESTALLDAVNEYYKEGASEKIGALLDDLLAYCSPFWQFERDKGRFDQEGKSIIGVQDKDSTLIPERFRQNRNFNIVSTGFRHSIDVVRVKHGVPAFLLNDMDEYKVMYDLVRNQTKDPLHILPNSDEFEDIFPDEHKESRQLFALGLVFGFIVQIGSFYYVDMQREYSGPLQIKPTAEYRLDQGRINAEESLIHKPEFRKTLARKVEELVQNMGNQAAIDQIEKAISELKIHVSNLPANNEDMRPQLRREISYLRAYQRMLGAIVQDF